MRAKWISKVMCALLAGVMVFSLVACGNTDDKKTSTSSSKEESKSSEVQASKSTEVSSSTQEEEPVGPGSITYPLDTDVSLVYWGGASYYDQYGSWKESPAHNNFLEAVGVDIDFQYVMAGSTHEQAFNLMLADEKLPNMVWAWTSPADAANLIADGLIYDITEYLPKYAPDFWEYINRPENETELKSIVTADGKFYCMPQIYEGNGSNYMGPIIRKDWLDEQGLKEPVTLEDWEKVLVTFKEKYDAKMGVCLSYFKAEGFASGTDALGFISGNRLCVNDEGKVVYPQAQPEWKELMDVMARWWSMGLIDEDSLTMDAAAIRNKALLEDIGVTFVPASQMTAIINDAEAEGLKTDWVGVSYPRTAAGAPTSMIQTAATRLPGGKVIFGASSTEEELAVALQVWNYAFTEEGIKHLGFGVEGDSYTVDANGQIFWTDKIANAELGAATESRKYSMFSNGAIAGIMADRLTQLKNKEIVGVALGTWSDNTEGAKHVLPAVSLTEDENQIHTTYFTPIATYVEEESLKFLTGKRSLDEYDDFVATLKQMGLDDVLAANQAAYDRFVGK